MISSFKYPVKNLVVVSLIFHLSKTTILFLSTESSETGCLSE